MPAPSASGTDHALPDFVIAGAQKCGTSSLYAWMIQHPRILPARRKEVHFFDLNYDRGGDWYHTHFPTRSELDRDRALTGESTPYYMFHPHGFTRMAAMLPRARIIMLLRDPVQRAVSHYLQAVRKGIEALPPGEALGREDVRISREFERMAADPDYNSVDVQKRSYRHRGCYAAQIRRCLEHFPRNQVLVVKSEELFAAPAATLRRMFAFLDLEACTPADLSARNVADDGGTGAVSLEVVNELRAYFAHHNRDLSALLQGDFSWP